MRLSFVRMMIVIITCAGLACGDDSGSPGRASSGAQGASSGSSGGGGSADDGAARICVDTINGYRKQKGLEPYQRWSDVEACADGEASSDASSKKPHGAFGKCGERGQNECPGWPGPAEKMIPSCLEAMWGEGPGGGHYEAMASKGYTKVACGFATAPNGQIWSVQNFQ